MIALRNVAPLLLVPLLALGACAGGEDTMDMSSAPEPAIAPDGDEMAGEMGMAEDLGDADAMDRAAIDGAFATQEESGDDGSGEVTEKAIIATGNVALTSEDVDQAGFDAQQVVDEYRGQVTDQDTRTDKEGEVRSVRMVIRVPAGSFEDAFAELQEVADLVRSSTSTEDVTTQVIDVRVRIRAQRRSLQRIEELLDRATSIRDIVRIESELTRRQAHLDSLEQQQAYLADQTSMSTITLTVERSSDEAPVDDAGGFLGGLKDGWHALVAFATGVATVTGWALPFAVVLLLVGVPAWLVWRSRSRRRPATP
ncbi:DUF4349 domain-containing protein [Nocardioides sp. YIM 152588]|uniref:DUF4349 domain-containing protein n=1 Tax=Nocardioides sp. YIM 152588 TaxID=3158259 RepID=UPI0032E3ED21